MEREYPISPSEVTIDLDELESWIKYHSFEYECEYENNRFRNVEVVEVDDLFSVLRRWNV